MKYFHLTGLPETDGVLPAHGWEGGAVRQVGPGRTPAHLAVEELEGGRQDGADVCHVDEHEGYSHQGVQHCNQLAKVGTGSKISISCH